MNRDVCSFSLSFFMHGVILGAFLYLCPNLDLQPKPLVIDFSLIPESVSSNVSQSPVKPEQPVKPPPVVKVPVKPRQLARPKPIEKVLPREIPEPVAIKEKLTRPVAEILPKEEEKQVQPQHLAEPGKTVETMVVPASNSINQSQPAAVSPVLSPRLAADKEEATSVISGKAMEQQYVKAHFIYIKKIIEKNITYPAMARRMGWQGKVVVSFIVCRNGSIENLEVVESSGFAQLDKNALETVRRVEPFPNPPVRVKLVLPVNYKIG